MRRALIPLAMVLVACSPVDEPPSGSGTSVLADDRAVMEAARVLGVSADKLQKADLR